jgi:hypothetical protein
LGRLKRYKRTIRNRNRNLAKHRFWGNGDGMPHYIRLGRENISLCDGRFRNMTYHTGCHVGLISRSSPGFYIIESLSEGVAGSRR